MPELTRKLQKILGGNSNFNGVFGSARASNPTLSNDLDVLQSLAAWGQGWNQATITGDRLPCLEEMQAVQFVITRQLSYLFQEGIPEYLTTETYYINSIVKESGTVKLYKSLTDNNAGNALSNPTHWKLLVDLNTIVILNNYTATTDPTVNDDANDGYVAGSVWYNSTGTGEAFLCVNPAVGAAKWIKTTLTVDELGTAAFKAFGTAIGQLVELQNVGGIAGLPAVDGSQLTNIPRDYVKLASATVSNVAQVDILSSVLNVAAYDHFIISIWNFTPVTDSVTARFLTSQDNGATWNNQYRSNGATINAVQAIIPSMSNSGTTGWAGTLELFNFPQGVSGFSQLLWALTGITTAAGGASGYSAQGAFPIFASTTGTNALRINLSSGNISKMSYAVYGVKK